MMLPEVPGGKWRVSFYKQSTEVSLEFHENGIIWTPTHTIPFTEDAETILRAAQDLIDNLDQLRLASQPDFDVIERQRQLKKKLGLD